MKIKLTSVSIEDYDKALNFYTEILGFVKKQDVPMGPGIRWITVVSPEEPDGTELLLEPNGIPFTAFQVDDIQKEYERLQKLGVRFTTTPTVIGPATLAVFDDTCGNLIQIYQA